MEKIKTLQVLGSDAKPTELEYEAASWQLPNIIKCRVAKKSKTRHMMRSRITCIVTLENNAQYTAPNMTLIRTDTQRIGLSKIHIYMYRCDNIFRSDGEIPYGIERNVNAADESDYQYTIADQDNTNEMPQKDEADTQSKFESIEDKGFFALSLIPNQNDENAIINELLSFN